MPPRTLQPELMDDPALDAESHAGALRGLARINRVCRAADALWPHVEHALSSIPISSPAPLSLLDLATGSADVPIELARRARKAGHPLDVSACDASRTALAIAADRAREANVSLALQQRDVVADGLSHVDASVDIVTCSLFLHHLTESDVVGVLASMRRVARKLALVSDLRRCPIGLAAAHIAGRVLTRSPVVRIDAVRSVRAAFTESELRRLANSAGMTEARIVRQWPFRMLMVWMRP